MRFFVLKNLMKTYLHFKKLRFNIFTYNTYFLKSITFIQRSYKILANLCKTFTKKLISLEESNLLVKKTKQINIHDNTNYLFKNIYLNKIFSERFLKYLMDFSFNSYFLDIFLVRQKLYPSIIKLREKVDLEPEVVFRLEKNLTIKPYWFKAYSLMYFYFYFFIDLKFNFRIFIVKNSVKSFLHRGQIFSFVRPFKLLQAAWRSNDFINFYDAKEYFKYFLRSIGLNFRNYLYIYILLKNNKKIDLNIKFFLCNLISFIQKTISNYYDTDFIYLNKITPLYSFFLGKWFYYRQINKIIDREVFAFSRPASLLDINIQDTSYKFRKFSTLGIKTFSKLGS